MEVLGGEWRRREADRAAAAAVAASRVSSLEAQAQKVSELCPLVVRQCAGVRRGEPVPCLGAALQKRLALCP